MAARLNRSIPLDTAVTARKRQIAAYIAMGPEQRVRLAASMSDDVRRVSLDGRAARTPRLDNVPGEIPPETRLGRPKTVR